ncbi:hypothetical protein GCM10027610_068030 [Dactylosporangium cerinum]
MHRRVQGRRLGDVLQRQVVRQGRRVDAGRGAGERQQRLLLAGQVQPVRGPQVVERFDAERVAGREDGAGGPVVQDEREHAPQLADRGRAPVVERGREDLRLPSVAKTASKSRLSSARSSRKLYSSPLNTTVQVPQVTG